MGKIFLCVLTLSILGSIAILWVLLTRVLLRNLPRGFSYSLWVLVFVRLICPFSLEGYYGLMPINLGQSQAESRIVTYSYEGYYNVLNQDTSDQLNQGTTKSTEAVTRLDELKNSQHAMNRINEKVVNLTGIRFNAATVIDVAAIVWLVGVLALIYRDVRHYRKLKKCLKNSLCIEGNLYRYNGKVPFVFGFIHPKIYMPSDLELDEATYIIQHEQVHIKRKDYLVKIIGIGIVNMHWFNPLVWLAFSKMSEDMELSCDEQVMKSVKKSNKKTYAQLLLKHATKVEFEPMLMFGKHPIQKRITHVLNYERTKRWKCLIAGIVVVLVGLGIMIQGVSRRDTSVQSQVGTTFEPAIEKAVATGVKIQPQEAKVSLDDPIGVEGVSLDYASESHVIFHDYFGLFVYDLKAKKMSHTLDLKFIDCHWMQGDNACEVRVNQEGSMILLHPNRSEKMMVYNLRDKTLTQIQVTDLEVPFKTEENQHPGGDVSYQVVMLADGEIGYLRYTGGTVKDITYYAGEHKAYTIFQDFFQGVGGRSENDVSGQIQGIDKQTDMESMGDEKRVLVEEGESKEVIARILKVDIENKTLLVEGLSENSPLGQSGMVYCDSSFVYKQNADFSQQKYAFEALEDGDVVSLLIDGVQETYPAQTYAGKIVWLGSRKDADLDSINYSIAYITKEGNPISLENVGEPQKGHIERLITQFVSTDSALPGRDIEEIGDFYRILCESKDEKQAYLIYQIGGEAYIQQGTYGDLNQIGQCREIGWADYQEITLWYK